MKKNLLWLIPLSLLLVACAALVAEPPGNGDETVSAPGAVAETEAAEAPAEEAVAETQSTEVEAEEVAEEAPEESEPAMADIGPPPEFSPDMKATDPENVVIGNGKPQVVEFFAFW